MRPPAHGKHLLPTCLCKHALGQSPVPPVLHHANLAVGRGVDLDDALDGLFFVDALDDVAGLEIQGDGVSARGDGVVQALDFAECRLQAVPLCLVLLAALGVCDVVLEDCVVLRMGQYGFLCLGVCAGARLTFQRDSFFNEGRPAKSCKV